MVGSAAPPPLLSHNHNILPHNLSTTQAKLLRIHQRRCHESMARIQTLAAQGKDNLPLDISKCPIPKCLDCEFSKAKALPIYKQGKLGKTAKAPGDFVSADQLIAGTPGIIPFHSGRPSTKRRYTGTNFWVDRVTSYIHHNHFESTGANEAIESKIGFEQFALRFNRRIKHIHADHGIYESKDFADAVKQAQQSFSFAGVSAHHQNGHVESYIGKITATARTLLLRAMRLNPHFVTPAFWPFAMN